MFQKYLFILARSVDSSLPCDPAPSDACVQLAHDNDEESWIDMDKKADVTSTPECMFCSRRLRWRNGIYQKLTEAISLEKKNQIFDVLEQLNQKNKTENCEPESQKPKRVYYHLSCLSSHEHKFRKANKGEKVVSNREKSHSAAFSKIKDDVNATIIEKKEIRSLKDIYQMYVALFQEEGRGGETYTSQNLLNRLLKSFPSVTKTIYKKRTFLHRADLSNEEIFSKGFEQDSDLILQIKKIAFEIRKIVKASPKCQLPKNNLTLENVIKGECNAPKELYALIEYLVKGPKTQKTPAKDIKISSICDSILYTMSNGLIKPSSCLSLGIATKSITGSRKMIEILNRMGFCINYNLVEEIETELAYGCSSSESMLPYGLKSNSTLQTHVAFDNFDKFVETSSGKDTLHDTVGIVYQNLDTTIDIIEPDLSHIADAANVMSNGTQRRRKYESQFDDTIEPYTSNNRTVRQIYEKDPGVPMNWQIAIDLNVLWMLSHVFGVGTAQRWFTWNADRTIDKNPQQKIGYLPNLNASPTSDAVVLKTMKIAKNIATECNQEFIIVSYDLAIASKAYKIQQSMRPEFDNVFINLGAFHIELSYFKVSHQQISYTHFKNLYIVWFFIQAIGKFIDSSGITKLMVESGLLAEGSVNGITRGKHFNRCKKLHAVAALSFKVLHFKAFLHQYWEGNDEEILYENEIIDILQQDAQNPGNSGASLSMLSALINQYNTYTQDTLAGIHGKTAQFVSLYVWFIELYLMFERAIRSSDLNLYTYSAYRMCALFFSFNHQNYARYLTRNLNDLVNIDVTHAGLSTSFENGALSIRRTNKQFCRSPIDLTLEQTINANAANKLTGITAFTNSLYARQRWAETHSVRTAINTHLLESLGLVKSNEGSDLYNDKMFNRQQQKFVKEVGENFNPFSNDVNPSKLFNLASGAAATPEVADFLLNVESNGSKQMETFLCECRGDELRFERPIKRNVIKNFASESIRSKNTSRKHADEAKIERNILGKLVCVALDNEIDLKGILSYPLAIVPHALSQFENSIASRKQKDELYPLLQAKNDQQVILSAEVDLIDGFNLLTNLKDAPTKYGQLARNVLRVICNTKAHEVHVFFHKHVSPSPRDIDMRKQKELYDNTSMNYRIKGPNQERTCSLAKCLYSDSFKEELVRFFIEHWSSTDFDESTLEQKRIFVSFGEKCYLFGTNFRGKLASNFSNNHFEIESKIILHLYQIRAKNISIKISNADTLLMYLIYHLQFWENGREISIQTGDPSKNNMRMINVRPIYNALTSIFVNALPGWYIFTGCIYEPNFHGKGRKTCWKVLQKNVRFQQSFANLGNFEKLCDSDSTALEEFTSELYGTNCKDVNDARLTLFKKTFGSTNCFDFSKKGNFFIASNNYGISLNATIS